MIIEKPKTAVSHEIDHKHQQSSHESAKMIENPQILIAQKAKYPLLHSQEPSLKNDDQHDENQITINTPKVNDLQSPIKLETDVPKKQTKLKHKD